MCCRSSEVKSERWDDRHALARHPRTLDYEIMDYAYRAEHRQVRNPREAVQRHQQLRFPQGKYPHAQCCRVLQQHHPRPWTFFRSRCGSPFCPSASTQFAREDVDEQRHARLFSFSTKQSSPDAPRGSGVRFYRSRAPTAALQVRQKPDITGMKFLLSAAPAALACKTHPKSVKPFLFSPALASLFRSSLVARDPCPARHFAP